MIQHTIEDFISAFGLRQKGREWVGPCPICKDGDDRFHVKEGDNGPIFGCRICIDNGQDGDGSRAKMVLSMLGGNREPAATPTTRERKPKEPPKPQRLPSGANVTVYHYTDVEGQPMFVVVRRDTPDGKSFSQWTPHTEPGMWAPKAPESPKPLYRLPEVAASSGKVAIVEGEKCVEAAIRAWPNQTVTCWAGGTNAWQQTDWSVLAGRSVSLLADGDNPGHHAMRTLAEHLRKLGCQVKIALPPVEWDSDVADWIAEGGKAHAAKIIADLLVDYQPPITEPQPPDAVERELEAYAISELHKNEHYTLLGVVGDSIAVRLRKLGRQREIPRDKITLKNHLITIAPEEFWTRWKHVDKFTGDVASTLGGLLMREADEKGQYEDEKLGRGAVRMPNGKIAFHLGDRRLMDGQEYKLDDDETLNWETEKRIDLAPQATELQMRALAKAIMSYRWATDDDGRRFLGWMTAAIVGGALEWRPHLMLTAPAGQGKTWLLTDVAGKLMGPLLSIVTNASTAAISFKTAHASLPLAVDEAEPSEQWVVDLMQTLRTASSNAGERWRMAPGNHAVQVQKARFCAWFSGTAAPAMGRADATRFTPISLGPEVEDWPSVDFRITELMMANAEGARSRIIHRTADIIAEVDRLSREFKSKGADSREAMASAALTAGWQFWGVDEREVWAQPDTSTHTDASEALLEILALRHRNGVHEYSVAEMLTDTTNDKTMADLLGVRRIDEGLYIASKHRGLAGAMNRTKWANTDIHKLLLQLEGAFMTENAVRFGSLRKRAVFIPNETMKVAGVEIELAPEADTE